MPSNNLPRPTLSVLDRVTEYLEVYLEEDAPVDVITFAEDPRFLGEKLYPRQKLILKVYYRLPLTTCKCYLCSELASPEPTCKWCQGKGVIDELEDFKHLLSCPSQYEAIYYPGLCKHHVTGECEREICHRKEREIAEDYRILSDHEIRLRLLSSHVPVLEVIAGRRGSKSYLGSVIAAYDLYTLLRRTDPFTHYRLSQSSIIGIGNAATNETQAQILFTQLKNLIEKSPWFAKFDQHPTQSDLEFVARSIKATSYHSNSAAVRGGTNFRVFIDEYCWFQNVGVRQSSEAMWDGLRYSTMLFPDGGIVIFSTPAGKDGKAFEIFDGAQKGTRLDAVVFHLATWEMNPLLPREKLEDDYTADPDSAEMELGAQFAEQVNQFIPAQAVEDCAPRHEGRSLHTQREYGEKGVRYSLHVDLSKKKDSCGLIICHYDKEARKAIVDRIEEFDPRQGDERLVTLKEIDQEKVLDFILTLRREYNFNFNSVTFDQFNSVWLIQRLRKELNDPEGEIVNEITITAKANKEMFGTLRSTIMQMGVEYPHHTGLMGQLKGLVRKEKTSGNWKVEAANGERDDLADALAAALHTCLTLSAGRISGLALVGQTNRHLKSSLPNTPTQEEGDPPHHPECSLSYCHFLCVHHKLLLAGKLPSQRKR